MKTTRLNLSEIVTTAGTQIRAKLCTDTVDDYATAMEEGAEFPPVVVFHDGNRYILADGFHRVMAATRNGYKDIKADIRKGSKSDALKFALTANSAHGLKRTNADKRRSVELALSEWPKISARELSKLCAVSHDFANNVKRELSSDDSCRVGADGKERKLPKRQQPDPEPEEEEERPHIKTEEETRPEPEEEIISKGFRKMDFGKRLENYSLKGVELLNLCEDKTDVESLEEELKGLLEKVHEKYLELKEKPTLKAA